MDNYAGGLLPQQAVGDLRAHHCLCPSRLHKHTHKLEALGVSKPSERFPLRFNAKPLSGLE
jgi:hypothetical protein